MGNLVRLALTIGAATLIAGCGAQSGATLPQRVAPPWIRAHKASGSYGDLLYVVTWNKIAVVDYAQHKVVGTIPGDWLEDTFVCSDPNNGNVFVTYLHQVPEILEFAHGGTAPIATLSVPSAYTSLLGCSVDPTTDNLAVGAEQGGFTHGAILIYQGGQGYATPYSDKQVREFSSPTYDDSGNIYADAVNNNIQFRFAELPAGKSAFTIIRPDEDLPLLNQIQWENGYLIFVETPGAHEPGTLYQAQVNGKTATIVGSEQMFHLDDPYFWIQGSSFYGFDGQVKGHDNRPIAEWRYPAGGHPTSKMYGIARGVNNGLLAITLSVAPSRSRVRR